MWVCVHMSLCVIVIVSLCGFVYMFVVQIYANQGYDRCKILAKVTSSVRSVQDPFKSRLNSLGAATKLLRQTVFM